MSKRGFDRVCNAIRNLDDRDAVLLGLRMGTYAKRYSQRFRELMNIPEFHEMWDALFELYAKSRERP